MITYCYFDIFKEKKQHSLVFWNHKPVILCVFDAVIKQIMLFKDGCFCFKDKNKLA